VICGETIFKGKVWQPNSKHNHQWDISGSYINRVSLYKCRFATSLSKHNYKIPWGCVLDLSLKFFPSGSAIALESQFGCVKLCVLCTTKKLRGLESHKGEDILLTFLYCYLLILPFTMSHKQMFWFGLKHKRKSEWDTPNSYMWRSEFDPDSNGKAGM